MLLEILVEGVQGPSKLTSRFHFASFFVPHRSLSTHMHLGIPSALAHISSSVAANYHPRHKLNPDPRQVQNQPATTNSQHHGH